MRSSFVTLFRKQLSCPSSGTLLDYQADALNSCDRNWVASHLSVCEFCSAESQLLSEHRPTDEECPVVEIPLHLRFLAEALLSGDLTSVEVYAETAYEKIPLTLTADA